MQQISASQQSLISLSLWNSEQLKLHHNLSLGWLGNSAAAALRAALGLALRYDCSGTLWGGRGGC